jgi:hypothetical protein
MKLLPLEPTQKMIEAGAQRLACWEKEAQWPDDWPLQDSHFKHEAERVWRAMWLAQENSKEIN